jgi:hypothetical protein
VRKLIILLAVLLLVSAGAFAQTPPSLAAFQTAFGDLASAMSSALAVNSTIGNTWSDAFIGSFPHFGVGLGGGFVAAGKDSVASMFGALQQPVPSGLESSGIPFPAAAANLKIGFPFLPIDVGIKAGFMPKPLASSLKSSSDVDFDYKNFGLQIRYALVKETFFKPDLSLGLGINYQSGSLSTPIKSVGTQTLHYAVGPNYWDLSLPSPDLKLDWKSTTFDFSVQASKTLLWILTPYIGAGFTLGSSTVSGGLSSSLQVSENGGAPSAAAASALAQAYQTATGQKLDLSSTGFISSADNNKPVLRVYGGVSLNILVVLDLQAMYIPATKDLGASIMARLQL